jgi:hypothetical protein
MKKENRGGFSENAQFAGGQNVTSSQSELPFIAGGMYVGTVGDLVVKTIDGSQITLTNASGYIPGVITHFLTGSTASNVVAFK